SLAIDDILPLPDRDAARRGVFVIDNHEPELTGSTLFACDVSNLGGSGDAIANPKRFETFYGSTGPHAARVGYRRHRPVLSRMSVGPELRHRRDRRRQAPVNAERRNSFGSACQVGLENGAEARHQAFSHDVLGRPLATDPLFKRLARAYHRSISP